MKVLAITGGHSYDAVAFEAFLDSLTCDVERIAHPDVIEFVMDGGLDRYDVTLHYDMPGVRPEPTLPPTGFVERLLARTRTGHGFVVLHHALASWPRWPMWAELVGGAYLYRPGSLRGQPWPDSGYRLDVRERLTSVTPTHPVLKDIPEHFVLEDETYLCPIFDDEVVPLLRTDAPITDDMHFSSTEALAGRRASRRGWSHPQGSDLVAWARQSGASRVVYLQPGDDAKTLGNPVYRRLVRNAVDWVGRRSG